MGEVDDDSSAAQHVFSGLRAIDDGAPVEGKAIVLFFNGDKYIGGLKGGKKHGEGMYVYADNSAYKGTWDEDMLDGVRHPLMGATLPAEVAKLQDLNTTTTSLTEALKQHLVPKGAGGPSCLPLQD